MKAHIVVGFALMALSFLAIQTMEAQTVISNETLVTTTFVVNKQSATAKCGTKDCSATASMVRPDRGYVPGCRWTDLYISHSAGRQDSA